MADLKVAYWETFNSFLTSFYRMESHHAVVFFFQEFILITKLFSKGNHIVHTIPCKLQKFCFSHYCIFKAYIFIHCFITFYRCLYLPLHVQEKWEINIYMQDYKLVINTVGCMMLFLHRKLFHRTAKRWWPKAKLQERMNERKKSFLKMLQSRRHSGQVLGDTS